MSIFRAINSSASGLTAERFRMDTIANNIANVNTTRTKKGVPYRRQVPVFQARENPRLNLPFEHWSNTQADNIGMGVRVLKVSEDQSPFKKKYEPSHPDADKEGYVKLPNVSIVNEMVDMITASRAYEANVTSINTAKQMAMKAIDISSR